MIASSHRFILFSVVIEQIESYSCRNRGLTFIISYEHHEL